MNIWTCCRVSIQRPREDRLNVFFRSIWKSWDDAVVTAAKLLLWCCHHKEIVLAQEPAVSCQEQDVLPQLMVEHAGNLCRPSPWKRCRKQWTTGMLSE